MFPENFPGTVDMGFHGQVMIPEVACRHLIGACGDRIKLLREESRCEARREASGLRVGNPRNGQFSTS